MKKRARAYLSTAVALFLLANGALLGRIQPVQAATSSASDSGFQCPAAPEGWSASSSNPTVFGSAQQPGQQHAAVICDYSKAPNHSVSVVGEYAVPEDPNPFSDFDYGCTGIQGRGWNSSTRTFFATSSTHWSYAEFTDMSHELPDEDRAVFETVAKSLLTQIEPAAHPCRVNTTTPTTIRHLFLFGFEFFVSASHVQAFGGVAAQSAGNVLIPDGRFYVTSGGDSTVLGKVVDVKAPKISMQVTDHAKKYLVSLRISGGIDFREQPPNRRLRLRLEVVGSNYPKCVKGSSGTVSISSNQFLSAPNAPATIKLRVCGAAFSGGQTRGTAKITTG